jgi:hypothetical protein
MQQQADTVEYSIGHGLCDISEIIGGFGYHNCPLFFGILEEDEGNLLDFHFSCDTSSSYSSLLYDRSEPFFQFTFYEILKELPPSKLWKVGFMYTGSDQGYKTRFRKACITVPHLSDPFILLSDIQL